VTPPSQRIEIVELPLVEAATAEQVRRLAATAPGAQDNPPISEQALLRLGSGTAVRHLIARSAQSLLGYAQLETAHPQIAPLGTPPLGTPPLETAQPQSASLELVATDPAVAGELLRAAGRLLPDTPLRLWAHGRGSVANQAAQQAGWRPVRTLLQLRRRLENLELTEQELPAGVSVRSFRPGQDDQAWLTVNSRAFATHPEQGSWTQADLDARIAAPWFDPDGFLLAEKAGELLGYHWTKVHSETAEPIGEVYVLGVDPSAQGMKLGKALLIAGLRYLRGLGLRQSMLYVEQDNTAAVRLYEGLGFTDFARDIQYARPGPA
jgi:mycothiol synthase